MKRHFQKLVALFLSGTMLLSAACSDYDDDISAVNKRIDELVSGKVANLEEQCASTKAAVAALEQARAKMESNIADLQSDIATLESADEQLQKLIDTKADAQTVNQALSDINGEVSSLKVKDQALQDDLDALTKRVAADEDSFKALQGSVEDLTKRVAANEGNIADLQGKVDALGKEFTSFSEALNEYKAVIEGKLGELDSRLKTVEEAVTKLDATVADMQSTIADMQASIERNAQGIKDNAQALKEYKELTQQTLTNMQAAIDALESGKVDVNDFNDFKNATDGRFSQFAEEIELIKGMFGDYLKTSAFEEYKAGIAELIEDLQAENDARKTEIATANGRIDALDAKIDELVGDINGRIDQLGADIRDELKAKADELSKKIDDQKEAFDQKLKELEEKALTLEQVEATYTAANEKFCAGVEEVIRKACENEGIITETIAAELKKVTDAYDEQLDAIEDRLVNLEVKADELINRIQSIVYSPAFNDHKAALTAVYAKAGDEQELLANGRVSFTWSVAPKSAAAQIVALYNTQSQNMTMAFDVKSVEVRTMNAEAAPELVIAEVKAGTREGEFVVVADAQNFPASFFEGKTSYSAALQLSKKYENEGDASADLISDYVNLLPSVSYVEDIVYFENDDEERTPVTAKPYEIEYNSTDVIALWEGYTLGFVINGEVKTAAELAAEYKMLPEVENECTHVVTLTRKGETSEKPEDGNFKVEASEGACAEKVSLLEADKTSVQNVLTTTHKYTLGALSAELTTDVTIIKAKAKLTLENKRQPWKYADFKSNFSLNDGKDYMEGKVAYRFELPVTEGALPGGITGESVAQYWGQPEYPAIAPKVTVVNAGEGETAEATLTTVKPVEFVADKNAFVIEIAGYEWGKTYDIVITSEFQNVMVEMSFRTEFVALPEKIEYDLTPEAAAVLRYDATKAVLESEIDKGAVAALYEQVKEHFDSADQFSNSLMRALDATTDATKYTYVAYTAKRGDDVITDAKHSLSWVPTWNPEKKEGYSIAAASWREPLKEAWISIKRADVVSADDKFYVESTFTPNYSMPIVLKGSAVVELPKYAVRHVAAKVSYTPCEFHPNINENAWVADVKGIWNPDRDMPVDAFTAENVDMESCFTICKFDGSNWVEVSAEEIAEQQLAMTFDLVDNDDAGITIADNKISYMGSADYVAVSGELAIDNVVVPTAFSNAYDGKDYTSFFVHKFDPIKGEEFEKTNIVQDIDTSRSTKEYVYNIVDKLSLKDVRDKELISSEAADLTSPWVVGDGDNGFVAGVNVADVYSLPQSITVDTKGWNVKRLDTNEITHELDKYITVEEDGTVKFDNSDNLQLRYNAVLSIGVEIAYPWDTVRGTVEYNILKDQQ